MLNNTEKDQKDLRKCQKLRSYLDIFPVQIKIPRKFKTVKKKKKKKEREKKG